MVVRVAKQVCKHDGLVSRPDKQTTLMNQFARWPKVAVGGARTLAERANLERPAGRPTISRLIMTSGARPGRKGSSGGPVWRLNGANELKSADGSAQISSSCARPPLAQQVARTLTWSSSAGSPVAASAAECAREYQFFAPRVQDAPAERAAFINLT